MSKKSTSKSKKEQYAKYARQGQQEINRLVKLTRHVKNHPQDIGAKKTLSKFESAGVPHRRKPSRKITSFSTKKPIVAKLSKEELLQREAKIKFLRIWSKKENAAYYKVSKMASLPISV